MNNVKRPKLHRMNIKKMHLNASIRRRLLSYIVAGVIILLLTFTVVTSLLTTKQTSAKLVKNAKQVASALAQQSTLALLTASSINAESAMDQVLEFPDVDGAGLVGRDGEFYVWRGHAQGNNYFSKILWEKTTELTLFDEDENHWYIASAIILYNADIEDTGDTVDEKLGYAIVSFSKNSLYEINRDIILTIAITGTIALIGLIIIIGSAIKNQLSPLRALTEIMVYNHQTGEHNIADVRGPREIEQMADSFNAMMKTLDEQDEKLRHHRDQLEAEVKIRTRELVEARDAALSSSRHKSEFLANMTHELRTPIQSIIGYVDLSREEIESEGLFHVCEDLDKITRNAERLLGMINSVLDLSKIEAGRLELNINSVYLFDLIRNVEEATAPLIPSNNNQFQLVNHCNNLLLRIDNEKMLQVLINLISNACKFTQNGKIQLEIKIQENRLIFAVSDTGIGIEKEKQQQIFKKFIQVDSSESRRFGGTGLGLAISKQFCELMKAEISVASEYGKGTTFTVSLPL
ncbi:sensor histidine kinase [Alteromonas sp. a30]|uniref:sensor histidine kinase n=1 Tax=Alteromonas sp. a30 TaxID=2730917 RepID=UPI00228105BB|nr:ATP-binding protein [Alteromonas sp. a30]MCY7294158.1 hypothetical protein [Alteromonas sp. a30]